MRSAMPLIVTLAAALGLALVFGFAATRLKLPARVGCLLAGVLPGPHTPDSVADADLAAQLAETGVMPLMFGVGLHFSLDDLMSTALALAWGWSTVGALVRRWPTRCCATWSIPS